jgi:UDP-N-acetylglucosamine--dolichyl-phosphate N-acetylglucosaminephosphotransferase
MKRRGLVGKDMNKLDKPDVPELGGIGVWAGLNAGIISAIFTSTYLGLIEINLTVLLAGYSTVLIIAFIGIIDDLIGWKKGLRQWQHALTPLLAALPLMAIKISNPPIRIPLFGFVPADYLIPGIGLVSFGLIYSLIFVPIGITGASNATNMLAGMNGLEAGLGAIIAATLSVVLLAQGKIEPLILSVALLFSLIAFLIYNKYPAKVFGGDSLTLMIGATIAAIVILGDLEKVGIMLMALFFIELVFKAKHKFQSENYGIPQKDGTLKADPRGGSLTQWVMRRGRFTEKQVTGIILGAQALISGLVLFLVKFELILI